MGLHIFGTSDCDRFKSENMQSYALADLGYDSFYIDKDGNLFCDDYFMYGCNVGDLDIFCHDLNKDYTFSVKRGKLTLRHTVTYHDGYALRE